ncbi:MAG: ABC transporter ATP-binding protein [Phycisphaerales bacterium JB037]
MSVIELTNLTRRYGRFTAVAELSLAVRAGSLFGFLGPNGAGKTTTIQVLMGLLRASAGGAYINGRDAWRDSTRLKREVGFLPGDFRFYPYATGHEALRLVGRLRRQDLTGAGQTLAERYDLDLSVRSGKMSRGMRQKLGIILALAHRPKLLILDEPTAGLDPLMQQALLGHLRELAATGVTVFFSSHTLSEVEQLCSEIAILRKGRLVVCEALEKLRERAERQVTITWRDAAQAGSVEPPPMLAVDERIGVLWRGRLTGPSPELLRWLSQQQPLDVTIGEPRLDALFQRFYREEEQ